MKTRVHWLLLFHLLFLWGLDFGFAGAASAANPIADFNGDGRQDILWHHWTRGEVAAWLMNGISLSAPIGIGTVADTNWRIVGVGDFDGDRKPDILWHHLTRGEVALWLMDGVSLKGPVGLATVADTNWRISGVGDFDGDGRPDILWHHLFTGEVAVWQTAGGYPRYPVGLGKVADTDWRIAGVGDFDGDGKVDILWRHLISGEVAVWLMDRVTFRHPVGLATVSDLNWQIGGIGDLNGDGKVDILWHHWLSGEVAIWLMNGTSLLRPVGVATVPDTNWRVAGGLYSYKLYGLDFSPYLDGQDPNYGIVISPEQIRERMGRLVPYTRWVRSFGSTRGLEKIGEIAHEFRLKAAVGAWLGRDLAANELEIASLINIGKAGQADLLIVGSEVLLRGDLTESQLIEYIRRVKREVPGVPVTTGEVYSVLLNHPGLIGEVDVVAVNYYPYWEGVFIQYAVSHIHEIHQQIKALAGNKRVIVSETGWPSGGNPVGDAVPSPENACFFFLNFVSWARLNDVDYFYFEAFDESWKIAYEGPQGAHWGVWEKDGRMKECMRRVFDGILLEDNWSGNTLIDGPGPPEILFTDVPSVGSFDNLRGRVRHVRPADQKVVVYIQVGGGWWLKPYFSLPLTSIRADGTWVCDITTGGIDETATRIAAYLVGNGYSPPLLAGAPALPAELDSNALAKTEVSR